MNSEPERVRNNKGTLTMMSMIAAPTVAYSAILAFRTPSDSTIAASGARKRIDSNCGPIRSTHQTIQCTAAGRARMHYQETDQHAETCHDDQKIEENDNLDQQRHPRNQNLRTEKDAVFEDQQAENLADRLVAHGQHQESEEFHRQHDRQSENDHMSCRRRLPVHMVRNDEGKHHHKGAKYEA